VRLRSVEVIPYALPFREPYVTARGALTRREMVLLRIRDEEGILGLGEAVPLSLRGGSTLAEVVAELEPLARLDPPEETALQGARLRSGPARCALSTALADLRERRGAVAARDRAPVACNATLVAGEPAAVAEDATRWWEEGFRTFKLKLGAGEDVAQVTAVREALGPGARIRVDANGCWDLATAAEVLAELEPLEIELAEQPVPTMEEAARLARQTTIPLAGDESIASLEDARRAAASGGFAIAAIKLSKVGGPREGKAIAQALPSYVSSALDGPVGIAAGAALARDVEEIADQRPEVANGGPGERSARVAHGLATQRLFASTIAAVECELREGMLHPPPGPGLGVEIDEDALAAHRL
jgi:o-succinylbenzoate synthase